MRMFYCTWDINNAEVVYARRNLNSEGSGNCHIFYICTPEVIANDAVIQSLVLRLTLPDELFQLNMKLMYVDGYERM